MNVKGIVTITPARKAPRRAANTGIFEKLWKNHIVQVFSILNPVRTATSTTSSRIPIILTGIHHLSGKKISIDEVPWGLYLYFHYIPTKMLLYRCHRDLQRRLFAIDSVSHTDSASLENLQLLITNKFACIMPLYNKMENKMEENKVLEQEMPLAERFSKKVILKVAKIVKVEQHPGGSLLYILTLNTGDEEERQIVSSIVPFYKAEELLNKNIVIVYNLKPANFRGVRSNGMLLAASDPSSDDEHETCEVLFAPQFEAGTILEPEGYSVPEEKLCYVKADKFFDMPLYTKDGFVEIDGKKIGAGGQYLTASVYKNGNVG